MGENNSENYHAFSPYVFAVVGLNILKISRDWSDINREAFGAHSSAIIGLGTDTAQKMPRVIPVLRVGGGIKYSINQQLSVYAEATYRFTRTDYLDVFKYAANPDKRDSYYSLSMGVSYKFGNNRYKCPSVTP